MIKLVVCFLLAATSAVAQTTTNTDTNCNLSGSTANCTSTSTTTNPAAQQQRDYQAGYAVGSALGSGLAASMRAHSMNKKLKKYCETHPNQSWTYRAPDGHVLSSGNCPPPEDKSIAAVNTFMAKHKDYIAETANGTAMIAYLQSHNLNPDEEKSYETAYKDLKKEHQLHLYAN